ncbi:MAG: protease modulator HflC [Bacillota bacterium]|nr:protease modulator HflC [Bacillota bacterium]
MKKFILPVLVILLILLANVTFVVYETQQVVITEFGKPVRVVTDPGLNFKMPFIHKATVLSKQILDYDSAPYNIYTSDKKTMKVDNYAKWRIIDPLTFLETLRTESAAQARLDDMIYSILREELGKYTFTDIIRQERTNIMQTVTTNVNKAMNEFGVELIDVRIKRADLPQENEQAVFNRMISERERMASRYLSEGDEESLKITSEADKRVAVVLARAYREAEEIKAEGDQEAAQIYNIAYDRDPDFYSFWVALNTIKETIGGSTTLFIPHDSDLARYIFTIE